MKLLVTAQPGCERGPVKRILKDRAIISRLWQLVAACGLFFFFAGKLPAEAAHLNDTERAELIGAVNEWGKQYHLAAQMIRRPFSSPGYHTTLTGGEVHPTRDSLDYAVALLDTGEPEWQKRAEDILRKVIGLQDQDPASKTYGIWSWFLEEPLEKMSPPDWNWADFCGVRLLQVAMRHRSRLPVDLAENLDSAIRHAARLDTAPQCGAGLYQHSDHGQLCDIDYRGIVSH